MNILNPESPKIETTTNIKIDDTVPQTGNESNTLQQKVDTNAQKLTENKEAEANEDPNWRAFREARKKDRAEKEAA
jgi:hypothetical protein